MFKKLLLFIPMALSIGALQVHAGTLPSSAFSVVQKAEAKNVLSERVLPLNDRYAVPVINDVFADNILLTLSYLSHKVSDPKQINWEEVRKPQQHEIVLQPGEVFAYHDTVMPEFVGSTVRTTGAHFNAADGFLSSGYLYGDGVCHLASVMNWAAHDAGLQVVSPVNHDFALIPDVPREYGTSIYYDPANNGVSEQQNLYIKNTFAEPVSLVITSDKEKVVVRVEVDK